LPQSREGWSYPQIYGRTTGHSEVETRLRVR
jgi:hypothetical protein